MYQMQKEIFSTEKEVYQNEYRISSKRGDALENQNNLITKSTTSMQLDKISVLTSYQIFITNLKATTIFFRSTTCS